MAIHPKQIISALEKVRYPGTGRNIVEMGMVGDDIRIDGNRVSLSLVFTRPRDPFMKSTVKSAEAAILAFAGEDIDIKGNIDVKIKEMPAPATEKPLREVKNIIAVASGKGGVGKSTVAANLAVALAAQGYRVGLLDADIFGPSQPKMFGVEGENPCMTKAGDRELIIPVEKYGVKLLSIGFFINSGSAAVWRGTMAGNAFRQLITDADWGQLDYFLVDLPPGTGDIQITLVQTVAVTGAVIVATPQEVALADVRKGISMFTGEKVQVPVLGIVENMSWFTPAELPSNRYYIFGRDGGLRMAEEMNIPLLGQIPIVQSICESGDTGLPAALSGNPAGDAFRRLAIRLAEQVEIRNQTLEATRRVEIRK
jgi:ATP-binding protein involved in chromosome partitioning